MTAVFEMEVTDADLAAMFGMTTRWIRDRVADGTIARVGRNRYPLGDSVQALIAYQTGGDVGEALNQARLRKLNADASRSELELAEAQRLVAPISEFEFAQSHMCQVIRANMRNVPRRAELQLLGETNSVVFKAKLLAEIDLALSQAADPKNYTKEKFEDESEQSH
ncbi:terminase small subunit [Burkholderia gladioli]|uniref:terminase small subunit n=1 Tax=Burkholderia gladioli TaxID=28095 RepID=UPI0011B1D12E|nr:terminase small subunit [Burkholderia gladioli]MDN7805425.1 terminase small subunit [Burkholderia gladioli]